MPKVSVIVPFYNVEKYIRKCLDTLVNQTLEDIEIILVNDGSKDNSAAIVKEYLKLYNDKLVYLEKENGGLSDARNYGIPYAKGEYIAFLDSDDYIEYDMYEKMYELAKKEQSDMVECDFYWEFPNKTKKSIGAIYKNKKEMLEKVRVVAWNKLIKREILQESKIQFPVGYRYEDVEFTYKLIPYLNKISFLKKECIHYIQRPASISNSQNEKNKDMLIILKHVIDYYKEKNIYEEYKDELEYIYTKYLLCSSFLRLLKIKDKKIRKEMVKLNWKDLNTQFPHWKENKILNQNKSLRNLYMRTVNSFTYKIYSVLFGGLFGKMVNTLIYNI